MQHLERFFSITDEFPGFGRWSKALEMPISDAFKVLFGALF